MKPVLQLSSKLIEIPSTSENLEGLVDVLEVADQELTGFPKQEFASNGKPSVLYSNQPGTKKFKVLFNAHLDIVPGKPEQYRAVVKNGRLFGRGAIDMKAAAAAEILAFAAVAKKIKYPLGLQLVTDEEIGGHHGTKHQISQGVSTELYLCGEYSDLDIGNQSKGVLWLKITTHGKRAHGAYLWKGINAITKLHQELAKIYQLFPAPAKEVWQTTCNVGVISGGGAINQVPDEASITLDIRRVPEDPSAHIIKKIKTNFVSPDTTVEVITDEPTNYADPKNPYLQLLSATIKSRTGKPPKFVKFHGASDARHYSAVGAVAIDFGPTGDGLHSDSEWIDLISLEKYNQILVDFLLKVK